MPFIVAFDDQIFGKLKPEVLSIKATDTAMIFSVTTQTYGGAYSPKHCLAIWITDQNNVFKKTIRLAASTYKLHLVKWNQMSGGNVVDAITGPSLTSHNTHTVIWDGKDKNGDLQPDGQYKIFIEYTEENSLQPSIPDGPWTSFTFMKGTSETQSPANYNYTYDGQSYSVYKDIFIRTFGQANIEDLTVLEKIEIMPNPVKNVAQIRVKLKQPSLLNVTISDNSGVLVHKYPQKVYSDGDHIFFWYPNDYKLPAGIYFVNIEINSRVYSYKIIVL